MKVVLNFDLEKEKHSISVEDLTNQQFDSLRIILLTLARESKVLAAIPADDLSLNQVITQLSAQ